MAYTWWLRQKGIPFFRLQVSERVGISLVGAYNRLGKFVISVCFAAPLGRSYHSLRAHALELLKNYSPDN